jgi:alcohol dehydrogenase class IV
LGQALLQRNARKIFLVRGKESFKTSGAESILKPFLAGYSVAHFIYNEPNPKIEDIERGIEIYKTQTPDVVIACGGGSVIDKAKLINFFASVDAKPKDWLDGKRPEAKKNTPLIAIPTTAGSGSEATIFAVLYIGKEKYSIEHESMLPAAAIVDPVFTLNLPPYITASSGMDALSQAIESYWSIHSTEKSKKIAARAIKLVYDNISAAVNAPSQESRLAMAEGAHLAGKAIRLTKTTAVHAISYPMTSYFGVPHGHACGLILPGMFRFVSDITDEDCADLRGKEYVIKTLKEIAILIGEKDNAMVPVRLSHLLHQIGLVANFNALGIRSKEDIETIISHGFNPQRVRNNPRNLTKERMGQMLWETKALCD